jgi:aquaporin Z
LIGYEFWQSEGLAKGLALDPEGGDLPDKLANVHLRRRIWAKESHENRSNSARTPSILEVGYWDGTVPGFLTDLKNSMGKQSMNAKKYAAEAIGTFWLTFAGCGSAVIAAGFPQVGIGLVGVSLAFGLSVVTMAYAIGHVSGCHLNPAVTVGLAAGGRFPTGQILPYVIAQVVGAIVAAALLYVIASGAAGFDVTKGFASNGYDAHSPGGYSMVSGFITEVVMTMMFLFVIMGATHGKAPAGFAPLAIGLALVMIHLVSIPVTNTSVNPARSTGPALFVGGWALAQLWMFWVAPLVGGALGGVIYRWLSDEPTGAVEGSQKA